MKNPINGLGRILVAGALLIAGAAFVPAQDTQSKSDSNKPTADQQKNNKSDRETTKQIRKEIMSDKSLSTSAHNVKVISQHGNVTLKGTVRSEEEKKAIQDKAASVAGASNVVNDLTVMAADTGSSGTKANDTNK
jgi:hyperosmotically inducible protein